jgi:hypothetical protein
MTDSGHSEHSEPDVMSEADPVSSNEPARFSRGRSAALVAALMAGAVLVGGGGYLFGSSSPGKTVVNHPEPLASGVSFGYPTTAQGGTAVGRADLMISPYGGPHIVFSAGALSNDPGRAQAWAFDAQSAFNRATIVAAAAALGVDGEPKLVDGSWVIGDSSGNRPNLQLSPDGFTTLSFYDPTVVQDACIAPTPDGSTSGGSVGSAGSGGGSGPDAKPGACPQATTASMSDDEATRRTRALLTAIGVAPDVVASMDITVNSDDAGGSYVSAVQKIDGQATGAAWNLDFVGDQLSSVYGAMAPLVSLGDYDVVSPAAAVSRLSDPSFGPMWGGGVVPMGVAYAADGMKNASTSGTVVPDTAVSQSISVPSDAATPDPTPPPTVNPGDHVGWPVQQVTITDARLVVVSYTMPSGAQVLLPAYELSDAHHGRWTVLAVADDALDFSAN